MKSNIEKVYSKLPKTELAKVELAKITELEEYEYELDKGRDELMKYATDAREAIAKGTRELKRLDAVNKVAQRILSDTEKAAKELGFMPDIQIDYSNAVDVYDKFEKLSQKLEKSATDIL